MIEKGRTQKIASEFEPVEWDALYEQDGFSGGLIFQRGIELAKDTCRTLPARGQTWLDVGCGSGRLTKILADEGLKIYGLDADERMLVFAKHRIKDGTWKPGPVAFIGASAERLPFGREKLDGVTAVSLMGCLKQPQYFFSEIYRILRPGGYAIITFTNRHSIILRANTVLNRFVTLSRTSGKESEHYHLYSLRDALQLFTDVGLNVREIIWYNFFMILFDRIIPRFPIMRKVCPLPRNTKRNILARNFLVVGEKRQETKAA